MHMYVITKQKPFPSLLFPSFTASFTFQIKGKLTVVNMETIKKINISFTIVYCVCCSSIFQKPFLLFILKTAVNTPVQPYGSFFTPVQ